ncbi:MAG: S-layer homology domain-containing protein [Oscillospiraceae bacterium]|jgi:hypothetical protein|nr:S-layer homology domain-containing protein [Oscillospiraceae bacterium]
MKLRNFLAGTMSVIMLTSIVPLGVANAADTSADDKALLAAIDVVKSRIPLGEAFEADDATFNFYKSTYNGSTTYQLNWNTPQGYYISANVNGKVITNFYSWQNYQTVLKPSFAKTDDAKLRTKAIAYIGQLNPTIKAQLIADNDTFRASYWGAEAYMSFKRVVNGVAVNGATGSVTVDKNTGELTNFHFNYVPNLKFDKTEGVIEGTALQNAYKTEIGISPQYVIRNTYDEKTRTYVQSAGLIYQANEYGYLDAFTGKKVTFNYGYGTGEGGVDGEMYEDADEADSAGNGIAYKITPQEQKAIDKELELLTAGEAEKIIMSDKYANTDSRLILRSSNLRVDSYGDDKYHWDLYFEGQQNTTKEKFYGNGSAVVDAKDGKILSYYFYTGNTDTSTTTELPSTLSDRAAEAVKSYIGDKFSEYRLTSDVTQSYTNIKEYSKEGAPAKTEVRYTGKQLLWTRYVNDIIVPSDTIYIDINPNGYVTNFNYNYSDVTFPSAKNMLTKEAAYKAIFSQSEFKLAYYPLTDQNARYTGKTQLAYTNNDFTLDALTGKIVDYDGDPIDPTRSDYAMKYSDVKSTSADYAMLQKLWTYGISLPAQDGKLNGTKSISATDAYNLFSIVGNNSAIYQSLYRNGTISGDVFTYDTVQAPPSTDGDKPVKRADAIKAFITAAGGSPFANLPGLYATSFKDLPKDSPYVGYFAFAEKMGLIAADKNGNIRPDKNMTRIQALELVYKYMEYEPIY